MIQAPKMHIAQMQLQPAPRTLGLKNTMVLTIEARSGFFDLGHAKKQAILRVVDVDPATGKKSEAAAIPLIANITFLVSGDDNRKWAEGQVASFDPDKAEAWDYVRFRETLTARKILPHSINGDPSENIVSICGEVSYQYDLAGRPRPSGITRQIGLWIAPDNVCAIRQTEIQEGKEVIVYLVDAADLPELWQQANQHMNTNIYPPKQVEKQPSAKAKPAPAGALRAAQARAAEALLPKTETISDYVREWQRNYKGPPLCN